MAEEGEETKTSGPLDGELSRLQQLKNNLDRLNSELENDLERLDLENQVLISQIQEEDQQNKRLEQEMAQASVLAERKDEEDGARAERAEALGALHLENSRLEKKNKALRRRLAELKRKISQKTSARPEPEPERLGELAARTEAKLQEAKALHSQQDHEIQKVTDEYRVLLRQCEEQALTIQKYQKVLRQMEEEEETRLLEIEVLKVQSMSAQSVTPGSILVEDIQRSMEQTIVRKKRRYLWCRALRYLFLLMLGFWTVLAYAIFHLCYVNPDLPSDLLPRLLSRTALFELRKLLASGLTLEVDDVLPH
ncbi:transmembrane and coiled-coil domain-containing protein 5A [Ornithorhynchus anatinus]|uniref:transmembrane and coiled-coil domain-containing protein 5A n=1 Tax=Ornithorhynchus anatinus TaxID=9258 RepID=UPI0010A85A88|nr:transmembrane and coiled-coil domain-containing protein 5A [Ornithorhynchus anatinus]XP_028933867.1 transmembrane and coiled-coil domain-containing protein 5A [Ornithorhynchus anatinus]XP_028933868.1 transmembrane and coiled-coil domain-containing protein 5A [Ornithorhynchus anatinus]